MEAIRFDDLEAINAVASEDFGEFGDAIEVTQEMINAFADLTGDQQWIHVDVERTRKESPFGGPIAHGYLTLSLIPALLPQVLVPTGFKMGVNYGCNKVRFMAPVPVGSKLRLGVKVLGVDEIAGGSQMTLEATLEVEGAAKPSCVAEVIYRQYE